MRCPFCGTENAKVIDSRDAADGYQIRRRRECLNCKERFTTFESAELLIPYIVKNNGAREPFNPAKLRTSLHKALEKQATREREVPRKLVGELAMEALKSLDKVAYIRFASVYLSFDDVKEFSDEIAKLSEK